MELAARYGYESLIVQVRARGDAFYASGLEPQAELLKGPRYDPLAYVISRAHAAGLQVHAWLNALFTWSGTKRPLSPDHLLNAHRDWLMVHESGRPIAAGDYEGFYVCPSRPEVQAHLWRVYTDVVQRYAVDGVHLDYIRYPGPDFCYCPACQKAFTLSLIGKGDASQADAMVEGAQARWGLAWPDEPEYAQAWADFRRRQVTDLLGAISRGAKRVRPGRRGLGGGLPQRRRGPQAAPPGLARLDQKGPGGRAVPDGLFQGDGRRRGADPGGRWRRRTVCRYGRGSAPGRSRRTARWKRSRLLALLGAAGFALFSYGGITGDVADETYFKALQARLTGEQRD